MGEGTLATFGYMFAGSLPNGEKKVSRGGANSPCRVRACAA